MSNINLKNKTITGMIWSAVQKFGCAILSFATNIILARLLTPEDFGCIGLLSIFILISQVFIDGGFGDALIQKDKTNQRDYSTIFFWNILVSLIIYSILFISAPYISDFYKIEKLTELLRILGLVLFINALGFIPRNRLRKRLVFKKLAQAELVAAIIATIVAVITAYNGCGVFSLIYFNLSLSVIRSLMFWIFEHWIPSITFDVQSFLSLFKYGGYLLISDLLNTTCDNLQGIIIGKLYNPATMGFYTQAKKLEEVPSLTLSGIVSQVTFPVFSSIKEDSDKIKTAHRSSFVAIAFVSIPLMLFLSVTAKPLIVLLYTEKWIESIPYFQILCMGAAAYCLQSVNYQLFVSLGYSKTMFNWNLIKRLIAIVLIVIGSFWGIYGLLFSITVNMWVMFVINGLLAGKKSGYIFSQQFKDIIPIVVVSIVASFICLILGYFVSLPNVLLLILLTITFLLTYLFLSLIFKLKGFQILYSIIIERIKND